MSDAKLAAIRTRLSHGYATYEGPLNDVTYLLARVETLERALTQLHDNTADYVTRNNLGDPYQNQDMRDARAALKGGQ